MAAHVGWGGATLAVQLAIVNAEPGISISAAAYERIRGIVEAFVTNVEEVPRGLLTEATIRLATYAPAFSRVELVREQAGRSEQQTNVRPWPLGASIMKASHAGELLSQYRSQTLAGPFGWDA